MERNILILAFDGVTLLDVISPAEVFDVANKQVIDSNRPSYKTIIASAQGAPIKSSSGIVINTTDWDTIDPQSIDTVIVPGGGPPTNPPIPTPVLEQLIKLDPYVNRVCSVCTGTFILGAAGLLEGREVTTHWQSAHLFKSMFPNAKLRADSIFVDDGKYWSSAGFTAGIDMALALLEEDEGYQTAIKMARLMVMFLKRSGGQSQFSLPLSVQTSGDKGFSDLHAWVADNLKQKITIRTLADKVNMTPRTFSRRYVEKVGQTPAKMIAEFRMDAACRLLTDTDRSLKNIANLVGYVDEQNMRRAFFKVLEISPNDYRQRFSPRFFKKNDP